MELMAKPLLVDSERISGLSGKLVRSHYDNNYLGALARLNAIRKKWRSRVGNQRRPFHSWAPSERSCSQLTPCFCTRPTLKF